MSKTDRLIGEIHATVKGIDRRLNDHLKDYAETKKTVQMTEKRQLAFFSWFTGAGGVIGSGIATIINKLST